LIPADFLSAEFPVKSSPAEDLPSGAVADSLPTGLWFKINRLLAERKFFFKEFGAVAQLVAHLHGMQGVRGSSPLSSTKKPLE
jgi:hypothetical protein